MKSNKQFYKILAKYLSELLKKKAAKAAFSFLVKKVAFLATGPGGWIFGILFTFVWDAVGEKAVNYLVRKGALAVDMTNGSVKAKKLKKAKESGDAQAVDDAVDDLLG